MRKIFVFLLFFITYTNAVELQNNKNSYLNNNEISYLKNKKALNVYIQKDWVPYNTIEFPQAIMFLKQYILLIGKKLNININFIDKKSKKHIDIICAKQKNDNTYIYSKNKVIDISFSLVTTKEQKGVSLNKLNGKKLAVVKDSSQLKYLRKHYPQIRLIECESHLDTLKFVLRKKVFAAFGNYFVLNYLIEKNFISGLNNIPIKQNRFIQSTPLYLAFNKDDTILKNIIDKITNSIDKESTYLLKKKWLGIYNKQDIFFTKTEKEFIKNHTITVNTTTSWMPINFFDTKNKMMWLHLFILRTFSNSEIKYQYE